MRLLLINPPYLATTTRWGVGHQVPLGLLAVGGPLVDAGHRVALLDAEAERLDLGIVAARAAAFAPDAILTGHAGSTAAHPTVVTMAARLRAALPDVPIVYGGVHPTYHAADILAECPAIDVIVRGEGEATMVALAAALAGGAALAGVRGIAFREGGTARLTAPSVPITDLDACRVGWELIEDWDRYRCWGLGRAAVVQLSRGCPHQCSYCGQRGFWTRQRYRTPERVADEIAWLHDARGVRFVDLADENPTTSPKTFRRFLEALAARNVDVKLFATIRADDVVRDAALLPLWRRAGMECVLMGMETTDAATLARIRKGSSTARDLQAIRLLREHGILSMMGHIVGFEEETDADHRAALRQILHYDPDFLNAMYVTPHRWTPFYGQSAARGVVEGDLSRWDYRHQVLATRRMPPWRVFLWVKATEAIVSLRPRALRRILAYPDPSLRHALRWGFRRSGRVWLAEVIEFLRRPRSRIAGPLAEVRGGSLEHLEYAQRPRAGAAVRGERRRAARDLPRSSPPSVRPVR